MGFPQNSPVGSSVCQTVTIIGDDIMEDDETFTVNMVPENDNDDIEGSTSVTITISSEPSDSTLNCSIILNACPFTTNCKISKSH